MLKTKGYTHLLGQSFMFHLNDGSNVLMKVEGETIRNLYGNDDQGEDVTIEKDMIIGSYPNEC